MRSSARDMGCESRGSVSYGMAARPKSYGMASKHRSSARKSKENVIVSGLGSVIGGIGAVIGGIGGAIYWGGSTIVGAGSALGGKAKKALTRPAESSVEESKAAP